MRTILLTVSLLPSCVISAEPEFVRVTADKTGFEFEESRKRFEPWGFNYDHDEQGRLIEDYWDAAWAKVEEDFREMKELGANVVRIHLQFGKFMDAADSPREPAFAQLDRLVALAGVHPLFGGGSSGQGE